MRGDALVLASPQRFNDLRHFLHDLALRIIIVIRIEIIGVRIIGEVLGQVGRVAQTLNDAVHVTRIAQILQAGYAWMLQVQQLSVITPPRDHHHRMIAARRQP